MPFAIGSVGSTPLAANPSDEIYFFGATEAGVEYRYSAAQMAADTGELDASSLLDTGWTADTGYPIVRRIGNVVELNVKDLDYSSGGSSTVLTLPVGFRPATEIRFGVYSTEAADDGPTVGVMVISAAGVVTADVASDNYNGNVTFLTVDAWADALA